MIASLPMYDRPETAEANDRLWLTVRAYLGRGPEVLSRTGSAESDWIDPDLWMSQTCGLPFRLWLDGKVSLLGAPDHGIADCPAGTYRSVLIARKQDIRNSVAEFDGAQLAFNSRDSQSGWAAAWVRAAEQSVDFNPGRETGSHLASAKAVLDGVADIAGIDCVSWDMMREWDSWTDGLKVIDRTRPTPALPFIAGPHAPADEIREALAAAIDGLAPEDRCCLRLEGMVPITPEDYRIVPHPPSRGSA